MKITKSKLAAASFGAALTSLYSAPELSAQVDSVPDVINIDFEFNGIVPFNTTGSTSEGNFSDGIMVVAGGLTEAYGYGAPITFTFYNNLQSGFGFDARFLSSSTIGLMTGDVFTGVNTPPDGFISSTGIQTIGFTILGSPGYFRVDLGDGTEDARIIEGAISIGPTGSFVDNDFVITIPPLNDDGGGGGPMVLIGDVNLDGSVGFDDVPLFIDRVLTSTFQAEADIDGDGEVGFDDVVPFIDLILGASEVSFSGSGDDVAIDEEAVKLQLREQLIAAVAEAKGLDAPAPASAGLAALALGAVGLRRRRKAATTA